MLEQAFKSHNAVETDGALSYFVRIEEAAAISGLPVSLIRKSFITEDKRPKNVPQPPPHKRIGRAIYIVRDELGEWAKNIGNQSDTIKPDPPRRGRPTLALRIKHRQANDSGRPERSVPVERPSRKTRS
jgi:hypothetical protein